jgi:hypothetical protein
MAVGECVTTAITKIADRFGEPLSAAPKTDRDSGSSVSFANGGFQVSLHLGIRDRALPPGGRGANVFERDASELPIR